ncbi:MAG: hypothetical protein Q7W13_13145 [Bacteroidia bacterium]|nr:hypothetical protein [Bacteroidia bacterium]
MYVAAATLIKIMTKQKAIEEMLQGNKVTHRHFSSDEWVTMEDGKIVLEDGVKCHPLEFWKYRTDVSFNEDWDLYISK